MGRNCGQGGGAIFSTKSKRKANGCMAAFYHLFDFQHLYFPSHHNLTIDSPSRSKGLKLIEESPPLTVYKEKQSLNIPVSIRVRIETGTRSSRLIATDTSSEMCNSPGSKTPSLVARLMGLDLLPEKTDLNKSLPSRLTSHTLSKKGTRLGGTRSLPESPRVSSARKSDFDIHRLSLQLNKESKREEFSCSRLKLMKQQDQEEIQSPRQILKQIKERIVTRRVVGMDITNSVKNKEARPLQDINELRRDTSISCSPRTRFSNKENKPSTSSSFRPEQTTHKPKPKPEPKKTKVILVPVSEPPGEKHSKKRVTQKELRPIKQCKKAKSETRFTQRPLKPSQTPDTRNKAFLSESTTGSKATNPLHKKKFKKILKSSDVDNNIFVTKPPQKHVHRVPSQDINEEAGIKANETEEIGPEAAARNYHGSEEKGKLCSVVSNKRCWNIREIAAVDIDSLLETEKLEEEGEEIVAEFERDIVEALVRETVSELNIQRRRS
ncbi:hypothetical protein BRARA_J00746 [Brassica rapa]|uniref:DUF3741 domain-containing protein n=1 Tax=Brassica campestris TaxID=3711 RepID=M4EHL6_BRACM|nr:muscle M-line assembly protein unc-89 [Brassica rapa]RID40718.1 hypothetical protein BRARA_J00746 [Brassica rapa]